MSRFTRNRKQIRKKQEAEQKIKDEHSAEFDKCCESVGYRFNIDIGKYED